MDAIDSVQFHFVQDIEQTQQRSVIALYGEGSAYLRKSVDDYDDLLAVLTMRAQDKNPVVIAISSDGSILDVLLTDREYVASVSAKPSGTGNVRVFGRLHDGMMVLQRRHPRFDALYDMLETARKTQSPVWIALDQRRNIVAVEPEDVLREHFLKVAPPSP